MKNRIICICLIALLVFTVGIGKPIEAHAAVSEVVLLSALILSTLSSLGVSYMNTSVDLSEFQSQFTDKISDYLTNIGVPIATAISYFTLNNNGSITAGVDALQLVSGYYQNLRSEFVNTGSVNLASVSQSITVNSGFVNNVSTLTLSDVMQSPIYAVSNGYTTHFNFGSNYVNKVYPCYFTDSNNNLKYIFIFELSARNVTDPYLANNYNNYLGQDVLQTNTAQVIAARHINSDKVFGYFYSNTIESLSDLSFSANYVGTISSINDLTIANAINTYILNPTYDTVSVVPSSFDNTVISNVAAYQGNYVADIVISGVASADTELLVDTVYTGVIENTFTGTATIADANISSGSVSNTYEDPTGAVRELNIPIVDDIINWLLKIWQKLCEIFNRLVQGFQDLITKLNDLLLAITQGFTLVAELLGDFFDIIGNYAQSLIDIVYSIVRFPNLFAAYLPPVWANFFGTVAYLVIGIWIFRFIINR